MYLDIARVFRGEHHCVDVRVVHLAQLSQGTHVGVDAQALRLKRTCDVIAVCFYTPKICTPTDVRSEFEMKTGLVEC